MRIAASILVLALAGSARGEIVEIDFDEAQELIDVAEVPPPPPTEAPRAQKEAEVKAAPKADAPKKDEQFAPFPGGIVDKEWKKAYIVGAGGTLDAIDLVTGKLLWRSAVQAIPLSIDGDRIYALAPGSGAPPALNVVGLSIKGEGKIAFKSDSINVEEWVAGDVTGTTLKATMAMEDGKMKLSWSANGMLTTAGAMRPGMRRVMPRSTRAVAAEGNAIVDLQKGTVEESKTKLSITLGATQITQGDLEYRLTNEAGKSVVECRDVKTKKTNWQVEVLPTGKAAAGTDQEMDGAAPLNQMNQPVAADVGELFVDLQAEDFHTRFSDEVMDPPEYGN